MKSITYLCLLFCLSCIGASAQDPDPRYFVAGGVGTTPYMLPSSSVFGVFGVQLSKDTYTYTSLRMTAINATLGQGLMQVLARKDNFTLSAIGDLGADSGRYGLSLAVAGGGVLSYDISRWTRIPGTSAVGILKVQRTGEAVQPTFGLGISKTF